MWQSSNPVLNNDDAFGEVYGKKMFDQTADITTVQGVVNKTMLLVTIAVLGGALGYWVVGATSTFSVITISCLASMGLGFGLAIYLCRRPAMSKVLAPIYGVIEGFFLGALSAGLDWWLADMGLGVQGGVALQAFIITVAIMFAMLALYKARILRPTERFVSVVKVLTLGIGIVYLISWPLWFFFQMELPFIALSSATSETWWVPLVGIGINVFILGVASMLLIINFGQVEERVNAGSPKYMEWYLGFGLLVSLAWVYYHAVMLVFRLAILFGGRD